MNTSASKEARLRKSYAFLLDHEQSSSPFTVQDLVSATGWKEGTARTYPRKKWSEIVTRDGASFRVLGVSRYSEAEYLRMMSQRDDINADPRRPVLLPDIEALVRKARESALLALQVYNAPLTVFRTEGFSVLMVIAWTSLFHAIFEKLKRHYFYMEPDGVTPKLIDGDKKAWELGACMNEFWEGSDHAVRRNLDFFIRFRNRVEHRYVPAIDPHVAGECQALILNFDELLVTEFGSYFAIRESLAVPLQTSSVRTSMQAEALRKLQAQHFDEVREFVDAYRKDLPSSLYEDPRFAFRVFLVPKVGNHESSSDLAFEFVKYDASRPEEMEQLRKVVALVREKQVNVANAETLSATLVVTEVAARIGREFRQHEHTLAWKRYKVRASGFVPTACDTKFCVPDPLHKDYSYTRQWVELLVSKLTDPREYETLTMKPKRSARPR